MTERTLTLTNVVTPVLKQNWYLRWLRVWYVAVTFFYCQVILPTATLFGQNKVKQKGIMMVILIFFWSVHCDLHFTHRTP